jgi:hypothetical protein
MACSSGNAEVTSQREAVGLKIDPGDGGAEVIDTATALLLVVM